MAPRMPLVSILTTPLIALAGAQALNTVRVDGSGSTCPPLAVTSYFVQPVEYNQYFQTAGEIININGGQVTINQAPTTISTNFQITSTIITSILPSGTVTITVDENGNVVGPGLGGSSTSSNPSPTSSQPTGSQPTGSQSTGSQPTGSRPTSSGPLPTGSPDVSTFSLCETDVC